MSNPTQTPASFWRKCSSCKSSIGFRQLYWVCNVSTCNRKRTGLVFCKVACWDAHVPMMNHRDSWALEERSPSESDWKAEQESAAPAAPKTAASPGTSASPSAPKTAAAAPSDNAPASSNSANPSTGAALPAREILIIASKLKEYIRARSGGMSTSDRVMELLSDRLRAHCNDAIRRAGQDGRKTVLDRDLR